MILESTYRRIMLVASLLLILGPARFGKSDDWPQWRGRGRLAVSHETGLQQRWSSDGPATAWTAAGLGAGYSSVAVSNGLVFTMGRIGEEVVYSALEEESGETRWRRKIGATTRNTCATPTVDDDLLYVVDPDGELVADSFNEEGRNIGAPYHDWEIEYFGVMMSEVARNMSQDDIVVLLESLVAAR